MRGGADGAAQGGTAAEKGDGHDDFRGRAGAAGAAAGGCEISADAFGSGKPPRRDRGAAGGAQQPPRGAEISGAIEGQVAHSQRLLGADRDAAPGGESGSIFQGG